MSQKLELSFGEAARRAQRGSDDAETAAMTVIAKAKAAMVTRVIIVGDRRRTSIKLELYFWERFEEIARLQGKTKSQLVGEIDADRSGSLASAIRLYIAEFYWAWAMWK